MFWDELRERDKQGDLESHLAVVRHAIAAEVSNPDMSEGMDGLQKEVRISRCNELDPIQSKCDNIRGDN